MAVTLKQIAKETGLSVPTVHQILNGYDVRFSPATRQKVLAAARQLNYTPNIAARSLVRRRSFLVGVLFYGVNYTLVNDFLRGLQASVKQRGFVPIFLSHGDAAEEADNLRCIQERGVDGMIVNVAVDRQGASNVERLTELHRSGVPMVEVFGKFLEGVPSVSADFHASAAAATRELISRGHRHITLFVRDHDRNSAQAARRFWAANDFFRGYRDAMLDAGLTPRVVGYPVAEMPIQDGSHGTGAHQTASAVMDADVRPTGVVCYTAEAAEALVQYVDRTPAVAGERKLEIIAQALTRPVFSLHCQVTPWPVPAAAIGAIAARMLFDLMAAKPVDSVQLGPGATVASVTVEPAVTAGADSVPFPPAAMIRGGGSLDTPAGVGPDVPASAAIELTGRGSSDVAAPAAAAPVSGSPVATSPDPASSVPASVGMTETSIV